jgi:hypothetical protein
MSANLVRCDIGDKKTKSLCEVQNALEIPDENEIFRGGTGSSFDQILHQMQLQEALDVQF